MLTTATSTSWVASESPAPAPRRPTRSPPGRRGSSSATHWCCSSTVGTSTSTWPRRPSSSRAAATPTMVLPVPVTASTTPRPPRRSQAFERVSLPRVQPQRRGRADRVAAGAAATGAGLFPDEDPTPATTGRGDPRSHRNRPWPANRANDTSRSAAPSRRASSAAVTPPPADRAAAMSSASSVSPPRRGPRGRCRC